MFTKDQFASAMLHECDVCLHLHSKLRPEAYGYRPSEKQRSTEELLRYLAICGIAGATCMAESNWKRIAEFSERTKQLDPITFTAGIRTYSKRMSAEVCRHLAYLGVKLNGAATWDGQEECPSAP